MIQFSNKTLSTGQPRSEKPHRCLGTVNSSLLANTQRKNRRKSLGEKRKLFIFIYQNITTSFFLERSASIIYSVVSSTINEIVR